MKPVVKEIKGYAEDTAKDIVDMGDMPSMLDNARPASILGVKARPVSIGTAMMLRSLNNPLMADNASDLSGTDMLSHCMEFLYLHTVEEDQALDYVINMNESERRRTIYKFSLNNPVSEIEKLASFVQEAITKATETQVYGEQPKYSKDDEEDAKEADEYASGNG